MKTAWHDQPRSPVLVGLKRDNDVYIPHPAPGSAGYEEEEQAARMGATLSLLKTLVIPAIISLILYLLISYLIVPIWKRYRGRYSNYLPLDTISTRTISFRQRAQAAVADLLLPSSWRTDRRHAETAQGNGSGSDFDEDEGEELFEVDANRREALSLDARRGADEAGMRLSRDLEEGFKDESDDEEMEADPRRRSISR